MTPGKVMLITVTHLALCYPRPQHGQYCLCLILQVHSKILQGSRACQCMPGLAQELRRRGIWELAHWCVLTGLACRAGGERSRAGASSGVHNNAGLRRQDAGVPERCAIPRYGCSPLVETTLVWSRNGQRHGQKPMRWVFSSRRAAPACGGRTFALYRPTAELVC